MEREESLLVRNARIVAIAGVVAGVAGGVAGRLVQRTREPTRQERLDKALVELTGHDSSAIVSMLRGATETAKHDIETSLKDAKKRRKEAGKRAKSVQSSGLSFADHMGESVRHGAHRAGESLHEVIDETTKSLGHIAEEVGATSSRDSRRQRKKLRKQAERTIEDLEARGKERREELMKLGKDTKHKADDRLHELEELARETIDKRVKPSLEKASASAVAGAAEARKRIEDEARQLEKRYEESKPKLEKTAGEYTHRASELSSELRQAAEERAHEAEKTLQQGTHQARQLAHDASESAKAGTRDAGSLLLWIGIAAGLVYLVFLNEEQKRKAREMAKSTYHEGMAMYRDVRGENADFSST